MYLKVGKNTDFQIHVNHLVNKLAFGNINYGTGSRKLFGTVLDLKTKNRGRVFYKRVDNIIEIIGKANEDKVIEILKNM